jgi:hypothetical protein
VFQFDEIAKEVYVIEDEALWRVWLGNVRKYQSLWFPFQKSNSNLVSIINTCSLEIDVGVI